MTAIRVLRILRKLSQRELAARLGVSQTLLHRVEHGYRPADDDFLERLAAALGMSRGDLDTAIKLAGLSAEAARAYPPELRAISTRRSSSPDCRPRQLGLTHQSCAPRLTELKQRGRVVDSGLRRPTRSGRLAAVLVARGMGVS